MGVWRERVFRAEIFESCGVNRPGDIASVANTKGGGSSERDHGGLLGGGSFGNCGHSGGLLFWGGGAEADEAAWEYQPSAPRWHDPWDKL